MNGTKSNRTPWSVLGLIFLLFAVFWVLRPSTTAQIVSCSAGTQLINVTLPTNGKWQLCWAVSPQEGVVLSDLSYMTPTGYQQKVLKQINLAQIQVAADDGSVRAHLVTQIGLGNTLRTLQSADCPSGTLLAFNGVNRLCQQVVNRSYVFKDYSSQKQGYALLLTGVYHLGEQSYIVQWQLHDDGTIVPRVGESGQLPFIGSNPAFGAPLNAANNRIGIGFTNNYFWRLHFDLGGNGSDLVEELEARPINSRAQKQLYLTPLTTEQGRVVNPDYKRSWRIRDTSLKNSDNHFISYHLEPMQTGYDYVGTSAEPWASNDIFFTRYNACEKYATQNPTTGGCAADVSAFVNGESINGADLVVWYSLTNHVLPRDEDEAYRPTRWHSFVLYPRDFTATSPIAVP